MKFTYKQNDFELALLDEPHNNQTFGILAIFRVKYIKWDKKGNHIEVFNGEEFDIEDYEYINYFCDQENNEDNLKYAKEYIDDYFESLKPRDSILEKALSIIKDYYMLDKDFFEIERKKEIEQNIKDLERILNK